MPVEISAGEAIKAYRSLEDILNALLKEALLQLRFEAYEALARALWMLTFAKKDIPLFEACYVNPPIPAINILETAAMAMSGAEFLSKGKKIPRPDMTEARGLKKKYEAIITAVFIADPEVMKKLKKIAKGRGNVNVGTDLIAISNLILTHEDRLITTGLIVPEEVETLDKLGKQILQWAQQNSDDADDFRDKERRAWTYMSNLYNEIRDHARLIYRKDLDTWKVRYPNLLKPSHSRKTKPTIKPQNLPDPKPPTVEE